MVGDYQKLCIYTFGGLLIRKGDKTLFSGNGKINKRWKLFLLLLFRSGETVSDQKLIKELDLDENFTPKQSLRALAYRLRKVIKQEKNTYIYTEKGGYGFDSESGYWLDCNQFKKMIDKAREGGERSGELYQQAFKLYKGSLLDNQSLENNLLLSMRNKYRNIYLEAVNDYSTILKREDRLPEIEDLYETALQLYPLNVDLYLELIDILKKTNKISLARNRAEEAVSFLRNSSMEVPPELQKEVSSFFQINFYDKPEYVLDNNNESKDKVFECGPLTFSNIYNLEKRRSEREEKDIYLIHFKLSNSGSPDQMQKAEKLLRQTLQQYLRSSDVITRWEPRHYLQLAVNLSSEEIETILQRIETNFQEQFPPAKISLTFKYEKI